MTGRLDPAAFSLERFPAQDGLNLFPAQGFVLDQRFLEALEAFEVVADDLARGFFRRFQDLLDLFVDDLGVVVGVVLGHRPEHAFGLIRTEGAQPQPLGEAKPLHHHARLLGRHLDV